MELILLLLLGGLAAGAGVWAASGGKKEGAEGRPSGYAPPSGSAQAPGGPGAPPPGEPVVHGGKPGDIPGGTPSTDQAGLKGGREKKADRKPGEPGVPVDVTYKTDQIIPSESQYAFQRRPLKNAEALIDREKYNEAISLYEKIRDRIPDSDIKSKINQNIQDLSRHEEKEEPEGPQGYPEGGMPGTAKAMESLADGLKAIAEELGSKMAEALLSIQGKEIPAISDKTAPDDILGEISSLKLKKGADTAKPENYGIDENGNVTTDGWTDEDFEKEWEKYKDLPLKDRRSGSRREGEDRRGDEGDLRKDRRDDSDRRGDNLFEARDEFLEKLEQHKKNKMLHEMEKKRKEEQQKAPKTKLDLTAEIEGGAPPVMISGRDSLREPAGPGEEPEFEEKREKPEKGEPRPEMKKPPVEEAEKEQAPGAPAALPEAGEPAAPGALPEAGEPAAPLPREDLGEGVEGATEIPDLEELEGAESEEPLEPEKPAPIQEIRGVLELKPPEEDDAPFLTLTYDFSKIPDSFKLSRDYHTMEYVYYKYKPMLVKAQEFTRRKMLKNALNYYRVIKSQRIPPEFKRMINRNIQDITEYLEKFLMRRS